MRAALIALAVIILSIGCLGSRDVEEGCAKLELIDWNPDHAVGEPVAITARLTNCGESVIVAPGCPDGPLEVAFRSATLSEKGKFTIDPCPSHENMDRAVPSRELRIAPTRSVVGSALWSGKFQDCDGLFGMCDPPQDPLPGEYDLTVTIRGLTTTNNTVLHLR